MLKYLAFLSSSAILLACSGDAAAPASTGSPDPSAAAGPSGGTGADGGPSTAPDGGPAQATDDPRSIFGEWKTVPLQLSSADVIVGVAPIDATHIWLATLARGRFSVRMFDGATWGASEDLTGASSQRTSGYGLRVIGNGHAWAYGPGILRHLEGGAWKDYASALTKHATWEADGVMGIGGWGDEAFMTSQESAYRFDGKAVSAQGKGPYAEHVFGPSATDGWAFKEKPFGVGDPAIYRNKGGTWTLLEFGDAGELTYPEGNYGGAASHTPGNVWALGNNGVMKQDGEGFKEIARPSADLQEIYKVIWTSGPNNTWVLGSAAYHYDGAKWTKAGNDLTGTYYGISGLTPDNVWAYGAKSGSWSLYKLAPK